MTTAENTLARVGLRRKRVGMNADDFVLAAKRRRNGRPEVVVVTGGSAGVGRAVARRFAQEGACVGVLARGPDGLEGARRDIEALGGQALPVALDVADADAVERAADQIEEHFGPVDVWVNNATVSVFSRVADMTADEFRRVTEVTYLGCVNGTLSALRRMLPRDYGVILQVGSALAYRAIPLQSAYCAAKHAIQGFTESLRCELMHDGSNVHVTMVHLPALNTPQFGWNKTRLPRHPQPVPPIYQPEVAASAIYYAAHHRRREMSVGYPTLGAIYGNRIAPGYLDRHLAKNGVDSQMTGQPVAPDRPNNLWHPVPGDHGAHGIFDAQSGSFSPQLWANTHRGWIAAAGLLAAGLGLILRKA